MKHLLIILISILILINPLLVFAGWESSVGKIPNLECRVIQTIYIESNNIGKGEFSVENYGENWSSKKYFIWGKYCKHKMAVALGDATILYDDEQIDGFNEVSNLIDASNYPKLFSEIRVVEQQLEEAKKNVKNMKEKIARFMQDGLK